MIEVIKKIDQREETYNSEDKVIHAPTTYIGNPSKFTHIMIGDSNIERATRFDLRQYQEYEDATKGLVLITMGGGMHRLKMVVNQMVRGIYNRLQTSFDDEKNMIGISIAFGYNKMDKKLDNFFDDTLEVIRVFIHILSRVNARWLVQFAEVQYKKSGLHHKTAQRNFVLHKINHLLGTHRQLRLWTAQIELGKPEAALKRVNVQNVEIIIERNMLDNQDPHHWHNKPYILELNRDVIFNSTG